MIEHVESVDSTNSELRRRIIGGTARILTGTPDVLVADIQTAGRGKDNEKGSAAWFSKPESCLTMSMSFTLPATNYWREHIGDTMMIGAKAAIEVLSPYVNQSQIITPKAPNDLYVGDKKIAGLLGEFVLESDDLLYCVLGIGLNITLTNAEAPFPNASSLFECGLIDESQAAAIKTDFPEAFVRAFCENSAKVVASK